MQRPTHKRAAPSTAHASTSQASIPQPKKARFVEPSEDPQEFEEQVASALETTKRKGRVKQEGYDSDSSDDGEGVVFSRRKGKRKNPDGGDAGDDENDDMFAMGDEENKDDEAGAGTKKKEVKFLRLGDITGQEFGGRSDSDKEDDEDEPEDEEEAERRKKAGMGYEMSSFNMREEMEEGKFAEDGTYVRTFDPHGVHDRWMDDVDDKTIKLARRAKRRQEREQKEKMKAEEREISANGKEALEKQLLIMLKKGESVLEALQRLGAKAKRARAAPKSKQNKRSNANAVDDTKESAAIATATSDIDLITHLSSSLMSLGDTDIYSKTYEELVRSVRSAGNVDPSWIPPSADAKYEYRWDIPGNTAGQVFGPFGEEEMQAWYKAAYFGVGGVKVKVRQTNGDWGDWGHVFS